MGSSEDEGLASGPGDRTDTPASPRLITLTPEILERTGLPKRYWGSSLEDLKAWPALAPVVKYAQNLPRMMAEGWGLFMYGDNGQGKTHGASVLLKLAKQHGASVSWLRAADCADGWHDFRRHADRRLWTEVDLLVIDDLGKEGETRMGNEQVVFETLLRTRSDHLLSTIVTTNVASSKMTAHYKPSMLSLMKGNAWPVPVATQDWRGQQKEELKVFFEKLRLTPGEIRGRRRDPFVDGVKMNAATLAMVFTLVGLSRPGSSMYSRVTIPTCDSTCQEAPLCDNASDWRCAKPKFEKYLFERAYAQAVAQGVSHEDAQKQARVVAFSRPETYEEGLERYKVIAQAMEFVAVNEVKIGRWKWGRRELESYLFTVTKHESGLRRDVHAGEGPASKGDCHCTASRQGKTVEVSCAQKDATLAYCKSACLGQINLGQGKTTEGWAASDLVGLDLESTKRCLTATARMLAYNRARCGKVAADPAFATLSGYGTGSSCESVRMKDRVQTYQQVFRKQVHVDEPAQKRIKELLGLEGDS